MKVKTAIDGMGDLTRLPTVPEFWKAGNREGTQLKVAQKFKETAPFRARPYGLEVVRLLDQVGHALAAHGHSVYAFSVVLRDVGKGNPRFGRKISLLISKVQTIFTVSPATRFTPGFVTLE